MPHPSVSHPRSIGLKPPSLGRGRLGSVTGCGSSLGMVCSKMLSPTSLPRLRLTLMGSAMRSSWRPGSTGPSPSASAPIRQRPQCCFPRAGRRRRQQPRAAGPVLPVMAPRIGGMRWAWRFVPGAIHRPHSPRRRREVGTPRAATGKAALGQQGDDDIEQKGGTIPPETDRKRPKNSRKRFQNADEVPVLVDNGNGYARE